MNKHTKRHRTIATIFLLIFFPTIFPSNVFGSNGGPKAAEAAGFEPVDATDMVNLVTGQYSYVLPLLNVPSPEGGYPIALSYHAGMALEQEASWCGLGWNINPGAIDRNINGYPDDYNASQLSEYFYDSGDSQYRSFLSVGYSYGAYSVALGASWGSNQALSGFVSGSVGLSYGGFTAGLSMSSDSGASLGVGYNAGGLSFGMNINSKGETGISVGLNSNGSGFSVGYNTSGSYSFSAGGNSANITLSSSKSGSSVSVNAGGVGLTSSYSNTVQAGDYSFHSSKWSVPIVVPTPIGIFSLSFGSQKFKYWLGHVKDNSVTGPIYFENALEDVYKDVYVPPHQQLHYLQFPCTNNQYCPYNNSATYGPHNQPQGHQQVYTCTGAYMCPGLAPHYTPGYWTTVLMSKAFMDINEISADPINQQEVDPILNNISFPNYDSYNVQAQGFSGVMTSTIFKSGALIGLSGNENNKDYSLKYNINGTTSVPDFAKFQGRPNFYMDNEISSYLNVQAASYNTQTNNADILNYYIQGSTSTVSSPRRKTSSFIEYYTNDQIINDYAELKQKGFLDSHTAGFERAAMPGEGIGGFKITAADGKTYHYSLPVYNHEIVSRTYGIVPERLVESQAYIEKRQLEPFATHWLLTAVTGSDYVDNGDGVPGDGDLGYFTSFEYGKWTDAFIWKAPGKKEYLVDEKDSNVKTWIRGRKQLYYLDKIKTRTHTALFVKSTRTDGASLPWTYKSVLHQHLSGSQSASAFQERFTIPGQKQLKLDKIILLKNEDASLFDKSTGTYSTTYINYNNNYPANLPQVAENKIATPQYNLRNNVIDENDNWQACLPKAIKVIDMAYDYSLFKGDGRLSLKKVFFNGRGGTSVLPPYQFDYIYSSNSFTMDRKDEWGYDKENPQAYSLNRIITPQGGMINIVYERNKFVSVTPHTVNFATTDPINNCYNAQMNPLTSKLEFNIKSTTNYNIQVGHILNVDYEGSIYCPSYGNRVHQKYQGEAEVIQSLGNNEFKLRGISNVQIVNPACPTSFQPLIAGSVNASLSMGPNHLHTSGVRVSRINTADGLKRYTTEYKYGSNEDGVGYVSYVPFAQNIAKELPYSSELPMARPLYEYVTVSFYGTGSVLESKQQYKFNVFKEKSPNSIKYGDFYEISSTVNSHLNTSANKQVSIGNFTIKDNLASIGQLLEITNYNSNGQQIGKVSNDYYKTTDIIDNNMGITQQSYQSYKTVDYINPSQIDKWVINSSTRVKFNNILKSSKKQATGYSYETLYKDYDLISGAARETWTTTSDGKSIRNRIIPAYHKYPEMGSKVDNVNNRNMLTQTAAAYSYIQDSGSWKVTGVGITTWNNIWSYQNITGDVSTPTADKEKIWRKHKTYIWNGVIDANGFFSGYNEPNDDGFVWSVGQLQTNVKWKPISEITLYDHYSMPLEVKDANNNKIATKRDVLNEKIEASGNAAYNELYYSGAETAIDWGYWVGKEVRNANGTRTTAKAHTGKYSIAATNTSEFGVFMRNGHRPGKYKISVWVHKDNYLKARLRWFNNNAENTIPFNGEKVFAGDWVLLNHYTDTYFMDNSHAYWYVNSADATTVYFDDLMIRPIASSISGYVYNEYDELTHMIGNNGLATRFEYDAAGRLVKTYVEIADDATNGVTGGFKLAKENKINYKNL